MPGRHYGQLCGVARSLDLLGERWTLLIVRELLLGPKRFGALARALPGIGPNLLSARLASLVDAGLAVHTRLPPPAAAPGYVLTERGEGLRESVESLAVWGFELVEPEEALARGELARGSWLAGTLAAKAARSGAGTGAAGTIVNFDVDGDRFYVRLDAERAHVRHGEHVDAEAELRTDLRSFYEMTRGERTARDPAVAAILAGICS